MVATDGHRLAFDERSLSSFGLSKGVILPRKGLAELKKLLESGEDGVISMGFKENMGLAPKFDSKGLSTIPASSIRVMIERTIFSVSTDETRYSLNHTKAL